MIDQKLARMANGIASFFRSYSHDQAVAGIHDHLRAFWTPKMRAALKQIASGGDAGLDPLVVEAVTRASHASTPAEKEAAGPGTVGEIGASDAG